MTGRGATGYAHVRRGAGEGSREEVHTIGAARTDGQHGPGLPALTQEELDRFAWQIMLPGFGTEAQQRLKRSTALVTRVGGLGGPAALNLCMAGIGKLVLAHGGHVELFHMNRMILARYDAVGRRSPATVAAERLRELNPTIELEVIEENANEDNVDSLVRKADIVLDCPPYFTERLLLNQACFRLGTPMIEAAMDGMEGYLTTLVPGQTGCVACLGLTREDWSLPFPVIGVVPCVIGSLAALEAVKVLTGFGTPLLNTLLHFDVAEARTRHLRIQRDAACPVCGSVPAAAGSGAARPAEG